MDADHQTETGRIGRQMQLYWHRVLSRFKAGRTAAEIAFDLEIPLRAVQHVLADHTGEPGPNDPTPEHIEAERERIKAANIAAMQAGDYEHRRNVGGSVYEMERR